MQQSKKKKQNKHTNKTADSMKTTRQVKEQTVSAAVQERKKSPSRMAVKNTTTLQKKPALAVEIPSAQPPVHFPNHPYSGSLRERLGMFFSPVLLALSMLVLTVLGIGKKISLYVRGFYYDHLYQRLKGVFGLLESIRASRVQTFSVLTTFGLLLPMAYLMRFGVSVTIDGHHLGYVENESAVVAACRGIEAQTAAITGKPYTLQAEISYEVGLTTRDRFLDTQTLSLGISDNISGLTELSLLKVNGEIVGACASAQEIQTALDKVEALYADPEDQTEQIRFLEDISVAQARVPEDMQMDTEQLYEKLIETTTQPQYYTVDEDDTMTSIARSHGMYLSDLLAMNPDVIPERMPPGLQVLIEAAQPTLSVEVVKTVDYSEEIPYDTVRQKDNTLAEDKVEVVQEGVPGEAQISARVRMINGVEQEVEILSRTVLSEATDKIISVGTKVSGIGSGKLQNPVPGAPITSGYKYRWGRMHKGVDLGVSLGTPVHAADSGKIIVSTYSKSGYGYYIIIDHGNGMKTLYGHNSKLLVNVGDQVQQGQVIAYSGNTGNSTGPHCHFEVMINNENVNPASYIS